MLIFCTASLFVIELVFVFMCVIVWLVGLCLFELLCVEWDVELYTLTHCSSKCNRDLTDSLRA